MLARPRSPSAGLLRVEDNIRSSYFGGNVDVFVNELHNGYLYDMNSQYPSAMLNDKPVCAGNPVYSTDKNLDNIFGFDYGIVIGPSEDVLKVPFIQYKDPNTGVVSCPSGSFNRMIFSRGQGPGDRVQGPGARGQGPGE